MTAVSIEAAKRHLRVTTSDDNSLIEQKLAAAEDYVAAFIGKAIPTTTVTTTDEFGDVTVAVTVPAGIEEAVLQQLAFLYDGTPVDLGGLLAPYREWAF